MGRCSARRRSTHRRLIAALAFSGLSGCSESHAAPHDLTPSDQLTIAALPAPDTIGAHLTQPLVVTVRNPDGSPTAGTIVRFLVLPTTDASRRSESLAFVGSVGRSFYSSFAVDTTDANGSAAILVALGTIADTARIVVNVPAMGLLDTARLSVLPGAPTRFLFAITDTTVVVGNAYAIHGAAADHAGNLIHAASVAYATHSSNLTVDASGLVTTTAPGVGYVQMRSGGALDSVRVGVLPVARFVVFDGYDFTIYTMNVDGTDRRTLTRTIAGSTFPHTTKGGSIVAYYEGNPFVDSRIRIFGPDSVVRTIADSTSAWPRWSADGAWLYYSQNDGNQRAIRRIHPDNTGPQTIFTYTSGRTYPLTEVGVTRDGNTVVVEDAGSLLVGDVASGSTRRIPVSCRMPQFSPDGTKLACWTDASIDVMDSDGAHLHIWPLPGFPLKNVAGIEWSADGKWILACGGWDKAVLMSAQDGAMMRIPQLDFHVTQCAFIE